MDQELKERLAAEWNADRTKMEENIEKLRQKISRLEEVEQFYLMDQEKLHNLFEKGIIDKEGRPIQDESESIMR